MGRETRSSPRELQLETRHLASVIFLVALLCVASFMLGRWVEKQAYGATAADALAEDSAGDLSVEEVNRELTYFRTLEGKEAPPPVEAPPPDRRERPVRVPAGSGGTARDAEEVGAGGGRQGFMVQVMATRDLTAAIAMRQRLLQKGYSVRLVEEAGQAGARLHKVRVGPYGDRAAAARAAKKLEAEEGVKTWIP
jgi:cell division septation protein DedD